MNIVLGGKTVGGRARLFFSAMAAALFSALVITGCGSTDDGGGGGGDLTLPDGYAWITTEPATPLYSTGYIFGTGSVLFSVTDVSGDWQTVESGTWSTSGNKLTITDLGVPLEYTYSISGNGNTLTLKIQDVTIMTLTKTQIGAGPGTGGNLVLGTNEAWVSTAEGAGFIFKANNDLVMLYYDDSWSGISGTYSTNGSGITLTIMEQPMTGTYSISGNSLTITIQGSPLTLTKTSNITYTVLMKSPNGKEQPSLKKLFNK